MSKSRNAEPIREIRASNGSVRYRVVVDAGQHPDGRRRQVTSTHRTKREARARLAEVRADVARGAFVARDGERLDHLLDRWLAGRRDVRAVTVQGYRDVLVPARQRLGTRRVQDLTIADVDRLADWMKREGGQRRQGLSPRTVVATLGALSQASEVWQHVRTDRLAAAWLLSLAGLRRSEVLGLRWEDIDLDAGAVRIERGRVAVTPTTDTVDEPKSGQSRRVVPVGLLPDVISALRALRARQAAERLALGPGGTPRVVTSWWTKRESHRVPSVYSDRFRALYRAARVPAIHLHATRHTVDVLQERYGRATAGGVAAVGERLGSIFAATE